MLGTFCWIVVIYLATIIEIVIIRKLINLNSATKNSLKENFVNFRGN